MPAKLQKPCSISRWNGLRSRRLASVVPPNFVLLPFPFRDEVSRWSNEPTHLRCSTEVRTIVPGKLVFTMLSILKVETILDALRGNPNEFDARVPEAIRFSIQWDIFLKVNT